MTAPQLRDVLLRQWKVVLVCMICATVASAIGTLFVTPQYQSTAVVHAVVSPATPNAYSLLVLDTLIGTEAQLAISTPILTRVSGRYVGLSSEELRKEVTVKVDQNTQLFEIIVTDPSPTRAAALANDLASALILYEKQAFLDRNAQAEQKIQNQLASLQSTISSLTVQSHASSTTPSQAADIQSQLDSAKDQYTQLVLTLTQLQGNDAQYAIVLRVAVVGVPAATPVRPVIAVNAAIGLASGFLLGVLLILLRTQLDQRIASAEEVAALLEVPVLAASASHIASGKRSRETHSEEANSFDLLSVLLQSMEFLAVEQRMRTVAVVGVLDNKKAGALTINWSRSLAMRNQKTLLVDANLFHPTLHADLGLARESGVTDAILAASKSSDGMLPVNSFLQSAIAFQSPYLAIMTAGTHSPNAGGLLRSKAMGTVFGALLATGAETIFFNAPPVLARTEAFALLEHVDGVVLVVDRSRLRKYHLLRTKARLRSSTAHVVGCVVVEQHDKFTLPYVVEESPAESRQLAAAMQTSGSDQVHRQQHMS